MPPRRRVCFIISCRQVMHSRWPCSLQVEVMEFHHQQGIVCLQVRQVMHECCCMYTPSRCRPANHCHLVPSRDRSGKCMSARRHCSTHLTLPWHQRVQLVEFVCEYLRSTWLFLLQVFELLCLLEAYLPFVLQASVPAEKDRRRWFLLCAHALLCILRFDICVDKA